MSTIENIPYQSFCWVIGTTSFRTAKLNLKIEQQLLMLSELHERKLAGGEDWNWGSELQTEYYDLMQSCGFVEGDAKRKDKDAREKTSGLVDIGLLYKDRQITPAGNKIVELSKLGQFYKDNNFDIEADSYVYLRQLLKTSINIGDETVRPYIVLSKLLCDLDYLSFGEFKYLLPICSSDASTTHIIEKIRFFRETGATDINTVVYDTLMLLESYRVAHKVFTEYKGTMTEEVLCAVGMNRKSRNYDKPYFKLYEKLTGFFLLGEAIALELYDAARGINLHREWCELLFGSTSRNSVKATLSKGGVVISKDCPFLGCTNEAQLREVFFKYLHVNKAKATLADYYDLNKRYFSLSDTIIFSDNRVYFDLIPKQFFKSVIEPLYPTAFEPSLVLTDDVSLSAIHPSLIFVSSSVYAGINKELNLDIDNIDQAKDIVHALKRDRLHALIEKQFDTKVLLELLDCFEERHDRRIEELVTKDADVPTMFEYIIGLIWYEISEREGNILDFMNLSLDANLLPKTHAGGGDADIVYKYAKTDLYPEHTLLLEVTLATSTNQRRMEMESVSRHLGEYRLKNPSDDHYCVFITTYLHRNVLSDFRSRKNYQYFGNKEDEVVDGMKIIPLPTALLRSLLQQGATYKNLYGTFDVHHNSALQAKEWGESLERELIGSSPL